jgi:SAM-dependent methyltransferase
MILPLEYKSKKKKKISEKLVREKIFHNSNNNLDYLLKKRFYWMKKYLSGKNKRIVIELGSGSGCIKKILTNENIILSDVIKFKWINKKINMLTMNLSNSFINKVDVFIFNHSLHHCPNPAKCLKLINKYLRKGGLILINEPESSFSLKLIQMITRDEAWSYKKDIFNTSKNLFKANDPWFSNTATAQLLFKEKKVFEKKFPEYKILKNELSEYFIFLNSGGVNSNIFKIPLNYFFLNLLNLIDRFLVYFFPSIFALNRSVVLKKN